MRAEIIAIGSELTSGAKLDTNSQWLSNELASVGIPVTHHMSVADELAHMVADFRTAAERADLVLITGGLGPTLDDLTRQALADLAGTALELDTASLDVIREMFHRRRREMPERNRIQAMFPVGAEPLPNECGTAPGIWFAVARHEGSGQCLFAALPGVPSEMKHMFHKFVLPRLPIGEHVIRRARINCFGAGESDVEARLGDLTARGHVPEVGITAHAATITLRITAQGSTAAECDAQIEATSRQIREILGPMVFGVEDEELQDVVIAELARRRQFLATAESGTGGLLAHWLTEVRGFEAVYHGGFVVPTRVGLPRVLRFSDADLPPEAEVSAETARVMALRCRTVMETDFALAITECSPPAGTGDPAALPTAFVALSGRGLDQVREVAMTGDPSIMKSRTAKVALDLLRRHLADSGN